MNFRIQFLFLILIIPFLSSSAQKLTKADKVLLGSLQTHIRYLADNKLADCRAGSPGEKLASDYISGELLKAGLQPRGDSNGWLQAFRIDEGKQVSPGSSFLVNKREFVLYKDYFPLAYSAIGTVTGSPAIALQESGVPWFVDLKDILEAGENKSSLNLKEAIRNKAKECSKKGATALILYNTSKTADNLAFDLMDRSEPTGIPVIYITKEAKKKYLKDESVSLDMTIRVGFTDKIRVGHNVLGYWDNGAPTTVILGAHYDQLGQKADSSQQKGDPNTTLRGADDNASGVAGLIELARMLKSSKLKNNNYLFIAFSGEDPDLFGSKYFVEHPVIDLGKVNFMINMDRIGRLNDTSHTLMVGGFGTSPAWGEAFRNIREKKFFSLSYDSSGVGPSDHTSFYRKEIPVLFFFTGSHRDNSTVSDDPEKINYTGELQIVKYIYKVMESIDPRGRISFTRTRETTSTFKSN